MKKYSVNGDFGQIRFCKSFVPKNTLPLPFVFIDGGWHRCNDLYHIHRPEGQEGYLLLFSITDGGQVCVDRSIHQVSACSVAILPPRIPHEYFTLSNRWWEFYWIHVEEAHTEFLQKLANDFGYFIELPRTGQIGKLIEELFPERFEPDDTTYEITASGIVSNILHILLKDAYHISRTNQHKNNLVQALLFEIESNYCQKLNISELAGKNYVSVQHLIRLFRASTGYSPYEYLKKYRLQKAHELLNYSDLSVSEISVSCGFSSPNNFIYQFRKEYGMSPGNYRALRTFL